MKEDCCTYECEQGRDCACRRYQTPEESRRFWRLVFACAVADIAAIALILRVLK